MFTEWSELVSLQREKIAHLLHEIRILTTENRSLKRQVRKLERQLEGIRKAPTERGADIVKEENCAG